MLYYSRAYTTFLSTPSARRATIRFSIFRVGLIFLSTPSARRATFGLKDYPIWAEISIHALREEGDRSFLIR